jgi:hypothetical protein
MSILVYTHPLGLVLNVYVETVLTNGIIPLSLILFLFDIVNV